MTKLMIVD